MNYTGTFQIPRINALAAQADKVVADFRKDARLALYSSAAHGLAEMGRHVPVLTGTTREIIDNALWEVQKVAQYYGGNLNLHIDANTKTVAKRTPDDIPATMYVDVTYQRTYKTPAGRSYRSREEWASVADGDGTYNVYFFNQGNQYAGKYSVGFTIEVPHWKMYDEQGVATPGKPRGPWHVGQIFNEVAQDHLRHLMPILVDHYSSVLQSGNITNAAGKINGAN